MTSTSPSPLEERTALVTGAARGIGRAIALRLAADGACVAVADLDGAGARSVACAVQDRGGEALGLALDVADESSVVLAVEKAREALGPIDILVNNAGVLRETWLTDSSLDEWNETLQINLTGCLLCARAVAPDMIARRWGRIVNLSSMMARVGFGGDAAYCASKAAVLGLTYSLAAELAPSNVCVNAICPGNIRTPMMDEVDAIVARRQGLQPGKFTDARAAEIPLGRLGSPEDIAGAVAFLTGPDASYITAQSLGVNGGLFTS